MKKITYAKSNVTVKDYATWIVKGGCLDTVNLDDEYVIRYMKSYVDALCKEDINKVYSILN